MTEIFTYARNGDCISLKKLLESKSFDINVKDFYGLTALVWASLNGHESTVKLLLEAGADPNSRCSNEFTALKSASQNGHKAIVKLLLEAGAESKSIDPDPRKKFEDSALKRASQYGHESIVKLLNVYISARANWCETTHVYFPNVKKECIHTLFTIWNSDGTEVPLELIYEIVKLIN